MSEFSIGDVVVLKSGGPLMTIENIGDYTPNANPGVYCVWFDERTKMEEVFHLDAVELYDNES